MNEQLLIDYAQVLIKTGVRLREGQTLVINSEVESYPFIRLLTKEAYACGAKEVVMNWRDGEIGREKLLHAPENVLTNVKPWVPEFFRNYLADDMAVISLVSANPYLLAQVPPKKIAMNTKATRQALKFYQESIMSSKIKWCVASVPTLTWANLLGLEGTDEEKMDQLWHIILELCRIEHVHEDDRFPNHIDRLKERTEALNGMNLKELHFTCPNGTDLKIELPQGHLWMGGAEESTEGEIFCANIPTEEVFSAPSKYGVSGIVYNTKPLSYQGNLIDGFHLVFEKGKVQSFAAKEGEEILKKLLETDEASSYLGEVALVDHYSPISLSNRIFMETLFDENASCHLAFGAAYPICLEGGTNMNEEELLEHGLNQSLTHVDFMIGHEKMTIKGITKDGQEIDIMTNGRMNF